jgi:hypothetical protein
VPRNGKPVNVASQFFDPTNCISRGAVDMPAVGSTSTGAVTATQEDAAGPSTPNDPTENWSDSDVEMADALEYIEPSADTDIAPDEDILKRVHGMFRLLDLVDEHGTGGIGESLLLSRRLPTHTVFS